MALGGRDRSVSAWVCASLDRVHQEEKDRMMVNWRMTAGTVHVRRLVDAGTLRWVQLAEVVELVQRGNGDEDQVPHHQDDTEPFVQLPAVHVGRDQQEYDGGQ